MYLISDYIELLKKENLICSINNVSNEFEKTEIKKVSCNSKDVTENSLFICKGFKYKKEYLDEAIKNGTIIYIAEEENASIKDFPHIIVNDIRKTLALTSSLFYDFPSSKINMIGITGTKGKSTTSYYIKSILDDYMTSINKNEIAIISSIDTYDGVEKKESLITSPESIEVQEHIYNAVNSNIDALVMEVSSQALKLDRVYNIMYDIGIFLNICEDHISAIEHPDFNDYFNSKLKIFGQVKNAIINLDSDYSDIILNEAKKCESIITFSVKNSESDVYAYDIKKEGHDKITFKVKSNYFDEDKEFKITMPGFFNVENALAAICTAILLKVPYSSMYNGLLIAKASGRMESHFSKDERIVVIVDYAHNKLSFEKLYESTKQEYPNKKIVTVFGCPGGKAQLRRDHLGTLAGKNSCISYLTAEDPGPEDVKDICEEIASYVKKENGTYKIIEDRGEAIKTAIRENLDSVILITGKGNETRQKCKTGYEPYLTDTTYALEALDEYNNK